jgi:hypothetical protein
MSEKIKGRYDMGYPLIIVTQGEPIGQLRPIYWRQAGQEYKVADMGARNGSHIKGELH